MACKTFCATLALSLALTALPLRPSLDAGLPGWVAAEAHAEGSFLETVSRSLGKVFGAGEQERPRVSTTRAPLVPSTVLPRPKPRIALQAAIGSDRVAGGSDLPLVGIAREIVAAPVDEAELAAFAEAGFGISSTHESVLFDGLVARLTPPPATSVADALTVVRSLAPKAIADRNHAFRSGVDRPCGGSASCSRPALGTACSTPVHIGVVGHRPDLNDPGMPVGRIEFTATADATARPIAGDVVAGLAAGAGADLPNARFTVHPASGAVDAYDLIVGLDQVGSADPDIVLLDVRGPRNAVLISAVGTLVDADIPVLSGASVVDDRYRVRPGAFRSVAAKAAALKASRPYLNVDGLGAELADASGERHSGCAISVAGVR